MNFAIYEFGGFYEGDSGKVVATIHTMNFITGCSFLNILEVIKL